ncbi:hypothetical protein PCANC_20445 [Puccinia coronata f. sp. avenae]|uniref:C2H2-type domain-containing protein n=1 Tax=Puccinia coronata f. sp. avenae TaxID=200324 RepID=A0A2N5SJC0_9BASI|nr:hypothetical protein PCANC_20445 [Puccinia coronata f. sp. avenae]PLW13311.1 hypothetical protein PCASD_22195 [Puccinia coronata f. sp. avenae]
MTEYNHNSAEDLVQLENLIDSDLYQDTLNMDFSNNASQDDCWQYENMHGSQTESQSSEHQVHQDYQLLARQTLIESPPVASDHLSWQGVQSSGYSCERDGHEPDYPNYLPSFSSGARELGWSKSGGSEHYSYFIDEQTGAHRQAQFFEGYSVEPTDLSYAFGLADSGESNTPNFPQCERAKEDEGEGFLTEAIQGSSSRALTFGYMYEPAPANASRPSLLSEWIDTSPASFPAVPDGTPPAAPQHFFIKSEESKSQAIEADGPREPMLGLYASACNISPADTGSPPDLSCSRRQTPGSGPITSAERPTTPYGSVSNGHSTFLPSGSKPFSSRSSSYGLSLESHFHLSDDNRIPHLDSRRSLSHIVSAISIPSPPQLFANIPISRTSSYGNPPALTFPSLLPPITDAHFHARPKENDSSKQTQPGKEHKKSSARSKTERPKRKRTHICNLCGKDFNRPSALLLHATVHTGERSNFCNVCGRSFSNLSNLRRHQRQLHVLESQMRLPEIPGPTSELDAYNFGSQTRF